MGKNIVQVTNVPDPYVFGPSGSVIYLYGSGPFHQQANEKNHDFYCFRLLYDFLSLKNDANVSSKRNKQRNLKKNFFFVGILKVNDKKSSIRSRIHLRIRIRIRIRIRKSKVLICICGSVPRWVPIVSDYSKPGSLVGVGSRRPTRILAAVTAPGTSRGTQRARRRIRNAGLIIAPLFIIIYCSSAVDPDPDPY